MDRADRSSTADGAARNTAQGTITGWGVVSGILVGVLLAWGVLLVLVILGAHLLPADLPDPLGQDFYLLVVAIPLGAALLTLLVPSWRRAGAGFALGLALGSLLAIGILWWLVWPILTTFASS